MKAFGLFLQLSKREKRKTSCKQAGLLKDKGLLKTRACVTSVKGRKGEGHV
jgi:hypothetical protein